MRCYLGCVGVVMLAMASAAQAASPALKLQVEGVAQGKPVPAMQALCIPTADGKSGPGKNLRPAIAWSGAPEGTKSFAVFMFDPDVPADFTDAGKEGKTIATDAKRQDFFHYGLVNIPATATKIKGGDAGKAPTMGTELVNDLGSYVARPAQFGGPCPPWNDARLHHYHFVVLALNSEVAIDAKGDTAKSVYRRLLKSDTLLARGEVMGTYTLKSDAQQ